MVFQRLPIITLFLAESASVDEGIREMLALYMISDIRFARMFEVRTYQTTRFTLLTPSNVLI